MLYIIKGNVNVLNINKLNMWKNVMIRTKSIASCVSETPPMIDAQALLEYFAISML